MDEDTSSGRLRRFLHFGLIDTDLPSLTRWLEERFTDEKPGEQAAPRR
ncbi:hypothetical protein WMF37_00840 [Sorangium sp. So ce291]